MRRSITVSALAATIVGLGTAPALAHDDGDDGAGFVPIEQILPDYYTGITFEACGDTITMEYGDVREVIGRETVTADGSILEYRGAATVDLTRESDGAVIDELDISGAGSEVVRDDTVTITLEGPSILFPIDPIQQAAWDEAGLPESDLAYFERGVAEVVVTVVPETGEPVSEEWTRLDARIIDLCARFDRDSARDHDWGHAHGGGSRVTPAVS
jgi:hypothetical protein